MEPEMERGKRAKEPQTMRLIERSVRESFDVQLSGCVKGRRGTDGKQAAEGQKPKSQCSKPNRPERNPQTSSQFPVAMTRGFHLFPYRTQKLSLSVPMVLGWTRPGRVGRCRSPYKEGFMRVRPSFFVFYLDSYYAY